MTAIWLSECIFFSFVEVLELFLSISDNLTNLLGLQASLCYSISCY